MTFRLTVPRKVLLLLLLPLVFLFAFVGLISQLRKVGEERALAIGRSKDIITETQIVLRGLTDATTAMTAYALTHDPLLDRDFFHAEREVAPAFGRLFGMLEEPAQVKSARSIEATARRLLKRLRAIELSAPEAKASLLQPSLVAAREGLDEIRREGALLLDQEQRLDQARDAALQHQWERIDDTLILGAGVAAILTILLGLLLGRSIAHRLTILAQNARLFAQGRELIARVGGHDEIGVLDAAFHDMAHALGRAMGRERAVMENAADVICSFDLDGRLNLVSAASERVFGYTPDELAGRSWIQQMVPLDEVDSTLAELRRLREECTSTTFETRCRRADGMFISVMWSASWSVAEQLVYGVARDVTDKHIAQNERQFYLDTIDRIEEAVFELDNLFMVRQMSHAWLALSGVASDHVIGAPLATFAHADDREQLGSVMRSVLAGEQPLARLRFRLRQADGGEAWVDSQLLPHRDVYGSISGVRGVLRDVTQAYLQELRIARLAMSDPLTQLPNRTSFDERLSAAITMARLSGLKVALAFVDVDNFKQINDRLGHAAGDQVLQRLAESLSRELRRGDTLSRWGGDEFVVLLPELASIPEAELIAERLLQAAGGACEELPVTLSIGIAVFPDHADTAEELTKQADRAMFRAKHSGRNNVQLMRASTNRQTSLL